MNIFLEYETLRKIVGYRFVLTRHTTDEAEAQFFLNEVAVLFHDSPAVITAIRDRHSKLEVPDRQNDNLVTLFKEMCKVLKIKNDGLNDEFLLRPFSRRTP
ncbi:hypothetical protein [Candidatus Spongiihabitans sp.]|uniref:hypothetical protein n=1 Tax=Candidatus Spongiihabitans sp. TaxID=3101308 RepID=UPI003C6FBDA2